MAYGGWKIIGADYYFFREDGSLYTGWLEQNGSSVLFKHIDNSLQGAMFTGWSIREGKNLLPGYKRSYGYWLVSG